MRPISQRDPLKAKKDAQQAKLVARLVEEHLPHLLVEGAPEEPAARPR